MIRKATLPLGATRPHQKAACSRTEAAGSLQADLSLAWLIRKATLPKGATRPRVHRKTTRPGYFLVQFVVLWYNKISKHIFYAHNSYCFSAFFGRVLGLIFECDSL